MDSEKQKRRQSLRIIVSEVIMVLAVIVTVTVLAFIVSGYWINSDFEVQRQGMLQISSTPTGAEVAIDGDSSWLQRTNTSKVLPSGEHTITVSRDGYDSWTKTIDIKEGLLYRIHYPRLFLQERDREKILSTTGSVKAVVSSNHNSMLITNNTNKWTYLNLNSEKLEKQTLDISKYFSNVTLTSDSSSGIFKGEILEADWDYDASHVLIKTKQDSKVEWVLIDVRHIDKSINLTKEFDADFSEVKILDNSSSTLLGIRNGNLHKIDIPGRLISAVLVENVIYFDHYNNEVVFTAQKSSGEDSAKKYYIGYLKVGDSKITELETIESPCMVLISKFYDQKYISVVDSNQIITHLKDDYDEIKKHDLPFSPTRAKVGHDGEYIFMNSGNHIAVLDMEADLVKEWNTENENFGWIDNDMLYVVNEGELIVYDFDGYNRRVIAKNVSSHFPVSITDNKWLYYFSDDQLIREWLIEH